MAERSIIHLKVVDPDGPLRTSDSTILGMSPQGVQGPILSPGARWRIACKKRLPWFSHREGDITHVCTPDPKAVTCEDCKLTTEYLEHAWLPSGFGQPERTLVYAGASPT